MAPPKSPHVPPLADLDGHDFPFLQALGLYGRCADEYHPADAGSQRTGTRAQGEESGGVRSRLAGLEPWGDDP